MWDILVCKDLWLPMQKGQTKPDKMDAQIWEVMHLKATSYIRCFIEMILYNNFNEENKTDFL